MPATAAIATIVSTVINAVSDAPPAPPQTPAFSAIARPFPVDTRRGELQPPIQQLVAINGQPLPVAPGLQVRNEHNLIVMPGTIQTPTTIRYQLDNVGNVWRIWILSAAEIANPEITK